MATTASPQPVLPKMSIVDLIIYEHDKVRALFTQFKASTVDEEKQVLCWEIVREVSQHAAKEEMVLYPTMADISPDVSKHCLEEHLKVKQLLDIVDKGSVSDPEIAKKFEEAIQALMHHMEEEETQFLPQMSKELSLDELKDMGMQFHCAAVGAPTRPHPEASQVPPDNFKANPKLLMEDLKADLLRFDGQAHTTTPLTVDITEAAEEEEMAA